MSQGNKPSHVVLVYDAKNYACRVGVAWPTKDGDGFTLTLQAGVSLASVDGARIVVIPDRPKEENRDRDRDNDRGRGNNRNDRNDRGSRERDDRDRNDYDGRR